ncbi:hypothetical protein M404DRAFT_962596, partial [Pisolithus tinctorius Marx 270]
LFQNGVIHFITESDALQSHTGCPRAPAGYSWPISNVFDAGRSSGPQASPRLPFASSANHPRKRVKIYESYPVPRLRAVPAPKSSGHPCETPCTCP